MTPYADLINMSLRDLIALVVKYEKTLQEWE